MQILKTSYEYPPLGGGGAKVVHGIATRLAARGHSVDLVTMGFRGLPATQTLQGVHIRRVPGIRLRISTCSFAEMIPYVLLSPVYVLRKIRAKQYLVNHTHFIYPGGIVSYLLKMLTGLPYVITAHGSDVPNYNPNRFRIMHRILRPLWRKIVSEADLILCPSKFIEDLVKSSCATARTHIIPNAIDTDKFKPRDKNPRNLLIVTRMFERKGVQYTLRALAELKGRFDVNIVGDGPYLATVKALAKELGVDVRFWGHLDNDSVELRNLYETAAIFVFTSEAENFPIVLLEAMIAGAAVISSSGTGCAEVVADSGLLVPVRDPEAIKSALLRLAADPGLTARLGKAARDRVIARFGWDGVIDQHLEVYARYAGRAGDAGRAGGTRKQLRILCPTYWYPSSADDTQAVYVHDINRHLVRQGHRVCVVTPGRPGAPLRETFDGVEVVRFPFELPEDLTYGRVAQSKVTTLAKINRMLIMARYLVAQYRHSVAEGRRFRAEVVHGHWAIPTGPALVGAARRLGIPSVITLHGGDVYVNVAEGYDFPTRWYVRPVLAWTLRSASALTAISEDCKVHALNAGAQESSISVVMNGADLRRFSPVAADVAAMSFGPRMIFACRQLFPRKGIRFLIEAVAKLRPKYPDIKLIIAGDGFERSSLEQLAKNLGLGDRTQFLGWISNKDLPQYYRGCEVSVIPSLEEGFGIPAAEAMGCEIPVVATDAGGLPEVVADGVTGFVVPKGDAGALADSIDRLLADPELRIRMGKAGRIRAVERFDWDHSVTQFETVYATVLVTNNK